MDSWCNQNGSKAVTRWPWCGPHAPGSFVGTQLNDWPPGTSPFHWHIVIYFQSISLVQTTPSWKQKKQEVDMAENKEPPKHYTSNEYLIVFGSFCGKKNMSLLEGSLILKETQVPISLFLQEPPGQASSVSGVSAAFRAKTFLRLCGPHIGTMCHCTFPGSSHVLYKIALQQCAFQGNGSVGEEVDPPWSLTWKNACDLPWRDWKVFFLFLIGWAEYQTYTCCTRGSDALIISSGVPKSPWAIFD